jgi:hypothetical protein
MQTKETSDGYRIFFNNCGGGIFTMKTIMTFVTDSETWRWE